MCGATYFLCRKMMMMMFSLNFRLALGEVWSNGSNIAHNEWVWKSFPSFSFFCTHRHPRSALIICVCLCLISLFYHTRPSRLWAEQCGNIIENVWRERWERGKFSFLLLCFKRKLSRLRYGLIESSTSQRLPNTQNLPESWTCDFQL